MSDDYRQILIAGAAALGVNEFFCITHPEGDLIQTASKDLTQPVRTICEALGMDWSDLSEQGYSLGKVVLSEEQVGTVSNATLLGGLSDFAVTH